MSDELKTSVVLRGLLDDRNQTVRLAVAAEFHAKADLHRQEALYQEALAKRLDAQAQATLMEAEIYQAEKDEFCAEAEAEISARENAEAIAALEAPAQPVHPDAELRDAPPAASEESGDQSCTCHPDDAPPVCQRLYAASQCQTAYYDKTQLVGSAEPTDWTPTVPDAELTVADLDNLATKASPEERAEMEGEPCGGVFAEPEIPEGFMPWNCEAEWPLEPGDGRIVEVVFRDGIRALGLCGDFEWASDIIAYRILEAPAPEQESGGDFIKAICTETCIACGGEIDLAVSDDERDPDMGLGQDGWQCGDCARRYAAPTPLIDVPAPVDGEYHPTDDEVTFALESIGVDPTTGEVRPAPTTDLWQQGYNDKLNGFDPSLAEPEYTKGYEARALIEREHSETMERAKFFEGGMMADADRPAQEPRSIVEKIGGVLGFKQKENA